MCVRGRAPYGRTRRCRRLRLATRPCEPQPHRAHASLTYASEAEPTSDVAHGEQPSTSHRACGVFCGAEGNYWLARYFESHVRSVRAVNNDTDKNRTKKYTTLVQQHRRHLDKSERGERTRASTTETDESPRTPLHAQWPMHARPLAALPSPSITDLLRTRPYRIRSRAARRT